MFLPQGEEEKLRVIRMKLDKENSTTANTCKKGKFKL